MTKEELIHITLKQLSESLRLSPENFKLEDPGQSSNGGWPGPSIVWQFKVKVDEEKYVSDPNNSTKTIIVTYNKVARQLQCYIFNREVNTLNFISQSDANAVFNYSHHWSPWFYRTYRQFMKLQRQLIKMKDEKEFMDYMKRLNNIFPATHEDDIFK